MLNRLSRLCACLAVFSLVAASVSVCAETPVKKDYFDGPPVFALRPHPGKERQIGSVGATGLVLRWYPGPEIKVEGTLEGSPAEGKFTVGDVVTGVNGASLAGENPFVALGVALNRAEASDGKMAFDLLSGGTRKTVEVTIPVLGAYAPSWPVGCAKSKKIIEQAAAYYAGLKFPVDGERAPGDDDTDHGVGGALVNLFLLSTGDDQYLPNVRNYLEYFVQRVDSIGNHTWNNGYNGILTAEYYLRTGDKSVLPVLQAYCDFARDHQYFGVGWNHWGNQVNPRYVAGGLMNPAGCQVLTTLLLAKECGVDVDEPTLQGALHYWYRFPGHGTVPYGDHRAEGGLGSNGKDGMASAAMQVASGAEGDTTIYTEARNWLSMSTLTAYPRMITGHADNGRGDGIWRGISSAYMLDVKPGEYHKIMNKLTWWYDISRGPKGEIGLAACRGHDDPASGAGAAMTFTAPLKKLRIFGAPKSEHAKPFSLPEHQWGNAADRVFLSIEHDPRYLGMGPERPIYELLNELGNAYAGHAQSLKEAPRNKILQNVFHKRYVIRAQAAKALNAFGYYDELEKLLDDADPRIRRAGLDGMIDYRYWFAMGKNPIKTENVTPAMIASIRRMLGDPEEAWYVKDGALMALSCASPAEILKAMPLIKPYTTHTEWWLRQASFLALMGAFDDEETRPVVLPLVLDMMIEESRPQARGTMTYQLTRKIRQVKPESPEGKAIIDAFVVVAKQAEILPGHREGEGGYKTTMAIRDALQHDPTRALELAEIVKSRLDELDSRWLQQIVPLLVQAQPKVPPQDKAKLTGLLYNDFRGELIDRMEDGAVPLDTIVSLVKLKKPDVDWTVLGKVTPEERVWRYTSFDAPEDEKLHPRIGKRFRDVTLPERLKNWYAPGFDDSQWKTGKAPIGVGVFHAKRKPDEFLPNRSEWGEGEFVVMRTELILEDADYDFYRIAVLANQGFRVYLNGHPIHTYIWWKDDPYYRTIGLGEAEVKHIKKGKNILAVYANCAYPNQGPAVGQIDIRVEGLRKEQLKQE